MRELYFESPQSIASLSQKTRKSVPLITREVQNLLAKGLLKDMGLAQSNGGRRANLFSINNENLPYILLISIDQKHTTLGIYDFANQPILKKSTYHLPLNENDHIVNNLLDEIDKYLNDYNKNKIAAISISMPGFVNTELGINTSYQEDDKRYMIKSIVENKYNKPTFIENDSTAIAIAEHRFGNAKNINDVLVINLNWGVGLGMIINNQLFRGSSGFAGEFSHIPLSNLNKLCSCGKRGCLEVEASLEAAISHALSKLQNGETSALSNKITADGSIDINDLLAAAQNGDQLAIESFGTIGYTLGKGIATLIHIINPEQITISGFGVKLSQIIMPQIQSALLEYSIQRLSEKTTVEISSLEDAQLIGTMATAVAILDWKIILQNINSHKS